MQNGRATERQSAELREARQVRVVLYLKVRAGNLHAEGVTQLLAGQLHGVEHNARGTLSDAVRVQVVPHLVQFHDNLCEFWSLEGHVAPLAGVGAVLPIEVKSGKDYKRHSALSNILSSPNYEIEQAVVLCESNVIEDGKVAHLPIYMIMFV